MQTSTTDDRWLVDHSGQIVDIRNFYAALATLLSFQPRMNPKSIQTIDMVMTVVYDGSPPRWGVQSSPGSIITLETTLILGVGPGADRQHRHQCSSVRTMPENGATLEVFMPMNPTDGRWFVDHSRQIVDLDSLRPDQYQIEQQDTYVEICIGQIRL